MTQPRPEFTVQDMLHIATEALLAIDQHGLIVHINRHAEHLLGYSAATLQHQPFNGLLATPADVDRFNAATASFQPHQGQSLEVAARHQDGTVLELLLTLAPIPLFAAKNIHQQTQTLIMLYDITRWKKAHQRQALLSQNLRLVLDSANKLMAIPDLDTMLQYAVEFTRGILNIERSAIFMFNDSNHLMGTYGTDRQRRTTDEHLNDQQIGLAQHIPREWLAYPPQTTTPWVTFDTPHYNWVDHKLEHIGSGWCSITPIYGAKQLLGIFVNDTALSHVSLNETQQEILAVYCSLLGHIIERKLIEDDVRRMLTREQELTELKSRLLHSISHEFRTPLSVILTSSEFLWRYRNRISDERALAHHRKIEDQVELMTTELDSLLTLENIEHDRLRSEPEPINTPVHFANLSHKMALLGTPPYPINYTWEGDHPIRLINRWLTGLIVSNLLDNAIKYSQRNTPLQLHLRLTADHIVFQVKDNGIGIPEADQAYIFDVFHRGKNAKTIHGIGLGLSIAQRAIMAQEGQIAIESQEGVGTTITVTLPAPPVEEPVQP